MRFLICGGAGYIGSHVVKMAIERGHDVIVVDNLSTGHAESVQHAELKVGDIGDTNWIENLLKAQSFDVVMHFCAHSLVGESVSDPSQYYINNVSNTLTLLNSLYKTGHKKVVFSSSAAVYGEPNHTLITEDHSINPTNPYGKTKWMVEQILQDYAVAYGFNSVSLRYFNAAGADPSGQIGEKHNPETHLIPIILKSVAFNQSKILKVFGADYPTKDGSCIRDYIHVNDIAEAHLLAATYLDNEKGAHVFNLGNGHGYSVFNILDAVSQVLGRPLNYEICNRRIGDPSVLVADATAAIEKLGWKPHFTNIEETISTAWNWHRRGENFI